MRDGQRGSSRPGLFRVLSAEILAAYRERIRHVEHARHHRHPELVQEFRGHGVRERQAAASQKSYLGACLASPMAWIVATALLVFMYFYVMKDTAKKLKLSGIK